MSLNQPKFRNNNEQRGALSPQKEDATELPYKSEIELNPDHEKYHLPVSEDMRHRVVDLEFEADAWDLHLKALENFDSYGKRIPGSGPDTISSEEVVKFTHLERMKEERNFFLSLENPKEQQVRRMIREALIIELEKMYALLDQKKFTSRNPQERMTALQEVLLKEGVAGKNPRMEKVLNSLYFRHSSKDKIILTKEQFIENALVQFDPLIFREAQQIVLGKPRETRKQAFEEKWNEIETREAAAKEKQRTQHHEQWKTGLESFKTEKKLKEVRQKLGLE